MARREQDERTAQAVLPLRPHHPPGAHRDGPAASTATGVPPAADPAISIGPVRPPRTPASQYAPPQNAPPQNGPNQYEPNQYEPNQYGPNQYEPNQHQPNQHQPNQHQPNQHGPGNDGFGSPTYNHGAPEGGDAAQSGKVTAAARAGAVNTSRAARFVTRKVILASKADGAHESGLTALIWNQVLSYGTDAMITVALASTVFFGASTHAQRETCCCICWSRWPRSRSSHR